MLPNTVTTPVWSLGFFFSLLPSEPEWKHYYIPTDIHILNQTSLIKLKNDEDLCLLQQQKSLLIAFLISWALDSKINQTNSLNKQQERRHWFRTQDENVRLFRSVNWFADIQLEKGWACQLCFPPIWYYPAFFCTQWTQQNLLRGRKELGHLHLMFHQWNMLVWSIPSPLRGLPCLFWSYPSSLRLSRTC